MTSYYTLISAIVMLVLGIIWKRDDIMNCVYKIVITLLGIWGIIVSLQLAGYIIKP